MLRKGMRVEIDTEYIRSTPGMCGLDETILTAVKGEQTVKDIYKEGNRKVSFTVNNGMPWWFPVESAIPIKGGK